MSTDQAAQPRARKVRSTTTGRLALPEVGAVGRSLHTRVADTIGLSILRGDVKPGQPLPSEVRLCAMLNVSRTAVREALRVLVGKRLLQSRPKSGTRVRPPEDWSHFDPDVLRWQLAVTDTDSYLRKLFELRFAIDPPAAALAARAATKPDLARIRQAFEAMEGAADNAAFVKGDIAFHNGIYLATHNELFWPLARMFEVALHESFRIAARGSHRSRAIAEHRELMDAVCAGDPARASTAAIVLLDNSARDLVVIRGRDPFRKGVAARPAHRAGRGRK
jgi:DNA-binding FadR family transcriptional regulator